MPAALAGRVRLPDASTPAARAAALRGASIFIAARNGSPLIAREAAACGIPIIAVAGSPGSYGVEHEVNGLIAQEGQPALVAACAGRLLADEPLRARLAAATSADGAGDVAERVEALYRKTAAAPPAAARARSGAADPVRLPHAHRPLAGLRDAGRRPRRRAHSSSGSARSPSPTTTPSPAASPPRRTWPSAGCRCT